MVDWCWEAVLTGCAFVTVSPSWTGELRDYVAGCEQERCCAEDDRIWHCGGNAGCWLLLGRFELLTCRLSQRRADSLVNQQLLQGLDQNRSGSGDDGL